jgi:hypothetical protein
MELSSRHVPPYRGRITTRAMRSVLAAERNIETVWRNVVKRFCHFTITEWCANPCLSPDVLNTTWSHRQSC